MTMATALASNALCTLDEAKEYLGLPLNALTKDALVRSLINYASAAAEREARRVLVPASTSITEYIDGDGTDSIKVSRAPIIAVSEVYDDIGRDFTSSDLIDSDDYEIYKENGIVRLFNEESFFQVGVQNVKVVYTGGYTAATLPEDLTWAICEYVTFLYSNRGSSGFSSVRFGSLGKSYVPQAIPPAILRVFRQYRDFGVEKERDS